MADTRPPRLDADERTTLCALLQYQRESLVRKVSGVSETEARISLVTSETTLLWLIVHMAQAESMWILQRFAGTHVEPPGADGNDDHTLVAAVDEYRAGWVHVDHVVGIAASLDERCRDVGDAPMVNLRWVLMHLLEETARHAGHADILRELIDGSTGR